MKVNEQLSQPPPGRRAAVGFKGDHVGADERSPVGHVAGDDRVGAEQSRQIEAGLSAWLSESGRPAGLDGPGGAVGWVEGDQVVSGVGRVAVAVSVCQVKRLVNQCSRGETTVEVGSSRKQRSHSSLRWAGDLGPVEAEFIDVLQAGWKARWVRAGCRAAQRAEVAVR